MAQTHIRPRPRSERAPSRPRTWSPAALGALLTAPTFLVLAVVVLYPALSAVRQSLYGAPGLDPETGFVGDTDPFVGPGNYLAVLTDDGARFWNAFANTLFFTVTAVTLETVLGVLMALVMARALRGRALVRAAILIPWAVPTAVAALLWRWIFSADGVANALLPGQVLWTTEGFQSQLAVIIAEVWKTSPFIGLLVLAGLQMIPGEVHEAARVDGATAWQRFWRITLPMVRPALVVAVLFRVLDTMRMFDMPYVLIGPRKSSVETLSMLAQDEASNVRFGPASAYAVILFALVFLIAFAFVKLLGADVVGEDGAKERPRRVRGSFRSRHAAKEVAR
ncbi:carbohydrate ABC transporter permease [Nocardiopsis aegyptia]|uniref:carbohydrate ABC transporter permease n=1 Tax=Nocardiopsis aegyptia TaxID=220378 RepID=UPI00366A9835